jgi:transcriptional regulator with XRE-family HTH domain
MKRDCNKRAASQSSQKSAPNALLLGAFLKDGRTQLGLTTKELAETTGIDSLEIKKAEAGDFGSLRVIDLMALCQVVRVTFLIRPAKIKPPRASEEILKEFDRLMGSDRARVFYSDQQDPEHANLRWDIVGDPDRNWLYAIVTNRRKRRRFGAVTGSVGGWSVAGQLFGMDVETHAVAEKMCVKILRAHKPELL